MANPQISYLETTIDDSTWVGRKRQVTFENTLLVQLKVLKETGRYDAFKLKWHPSYNDPKNTWPVPNHLFWDSDVAKWIEGACYLLQWRKNSEVEAAIHELVDMIRSAQQSDGYLNIHFTVVEPDKRFSNLRDLHELYNAGHLIEAALAHAQLFQTPALLSPILAYVDLLASKFGPAPSQTHGYPGHPEIELALLRLYKHTHDSKHLDLARYFLTERGNPAGENGGHYFEIEAERRGDDPNARPAYWAGRRALWYYQAHVPLVQQGSIEGHSVRATYLLTALADLLTLDESLRGPGSEYRVALTRLWENMTAKKMYLTGGIGAMAQYEGFGVEYFLPQASDEGGCYAETCAGIGVMMLAERMLQLDLRGEYTDVMELAFYNAVMGGMSVSGKEFSYENQLASSPGMECRREEWFTCACCPPNVLRLMGYFGGYLWTKKVSEGERVEVNVHMYQSATLRFEAGGQEVVLSMKGNYPWEGRIEFELQSKVETTVRLHIPGWAEDNWSITPTSSSELTTGYLLLEPSFTKSNPIFTLNLPLRSRIISPHPYTNQPTVALARGPMVYCIESQDHPWVTDHFKSTLFNPSAPRTEEFVTDEETQEQYVRLTAHGAGSVLDTERLDEARPVVEGLAAEEGRVVDMGRGRRDLVFVPFYFRANRKAGKRGQMRVGLRRWT